MKVHTNPVPPYSEDTTDQFIDLEELVRRIPVSRRTILNLRHRGVIPFVKCGDRVLFHWPSVKNALIRRQREAA